MVLLVLVETSCQNTEIESTTPMPTEDATGGVAGLKVDTTPPSTHYCCREIDWGNDWCRAERGCLGMGCQATNASQCPALSSCICFERFGYRSTATCSILKSCAEALDDYSEAVKAAERINSLKVSQMPGCADALINVICAYHFPMCDDDQTVANQICISTCQNMYAGCVPSDECQPGTNRSVLDDFGQPMKDADGVDLTEPCPNTTIGYITGVAGAAKDGLNDVTNDALDAAGTSSEDITGAVGGGRRSMGGRSRQEDFAGWFGASLRGVINDVYYEFEPNKIKLSDFARDGSKCNTCLTPAEVEKGTKCPTNSVQYLRANGEGEAAPKCTSPAPRSSRPSMLVAALSAGFLLYALWA